MGSVEAQVELRPIRKEMEDAFLDYAMSVIVDRALPDVRDGLKPVHRRILYSMWQNGLRSGAKFKKCATVVGDVLGKYHPHGDVAIYDSLVRMAQDFSMRYPLIRGQGNFGSLDGDPPAAHRYTESKLETIADEILVDIERETVNFRPNFDGSHHEPIVLPAKLPNLLLNGNLGIAVGMATNIPPHNLSELCEAIIHLIDYPQATIEDLLAFVKGPDFPTGGIIYNQNDIRQAYATGKGGVVVRAKTEIIEAKNGHQIIVHEIPYQVNKAVLLEKIASLVREKKIEGIRDLWDESTKDGVRIVIELKREAYPKKVLNRLFQLTPLQEVFHYNMIALIDGIQPRILTLKMILEEYLKHRQEVVRRRTTFDLKRAQERLHILEGLRIALLHIDAIIRTIKKSKDKEAAQVNLRKEFHLSEIQTIAILEMRLQQLANLERVKIEQEYEEKQKLIAKLQAILGSEKHIFQIIRQEVKEIKEAYVDERRTTIMARGIKEFSMEDVIPDVPTVILITKGGYIKRLSPDTFKTQKRGGKGVVGLTTKEEDEVEHLFSTSTHKDLYFFTTRGRVFKWKAYDVPETTRTAKGQALVNFLSLAPGEMVSATLSLGEIEDAKYLVMATRNGTIKKTAIEDFEHIRSNGLMALKLRHEDILEWVHPTTGNDQIILITQKGQAIRFKEKDIRPMGRLAAGVRGIRLKGSDTIIGMEVITKEQEKTGIYQLLIVSSQGFGKRTPLSEYKIQGRGGSGIRTANVTSKTGEVVTGRMVEEKDKRDLMMVSSDGQVIRIGISSISILGRATQGVHIMRFKKVKDTVASTEIISQELD
ncbi:DNA gyrase subunit A [Candidatus Uhrbacteria bacterium CG_4_9_14_3_um_filter_36_7]|uniref:DNA gyrase subunit A n=1 Tax=Candidatus Uhrbacteria bacterium CG_4_9_14_3_um_filter_36_7 TaxID=1975033 RepID=A0A2M7XHG7_9BACT|nr:MAG: DNA gyrase subunit A [Candidatus Uhrbacteria bacterium CG_4_9_14_3_um_filter_36_7]